MFAMRRGAALALGAVVLLSGCSGDPDPSASPEQQVEADSPPANAEEARQVLVENKLCETDPVPVPGDGFVIDALEGKVTGGSICSDAEDRTIAVFVDFASKADRDLVGGNSSGDAWVPNGDQPWAVQFYDSADGRRAAQLFGDSLKQVAGRPASS